MWSSSPKKMRLKTSPTCAAMASTLTSVTVQVQFGPDLRDLAAQQRAALELGHVLDLAVHAVQEAAQHVVVVDRVEWEAVADHHRLQVEVDQRRDQRVLERGHDHHVEDEVVVGAALALHAPPQRVLLAGRHLVDDQNFEVWPGQLGLALAVGLDLRGQLVVAVQGVGVVAVGARGQHAVDAARGLVRARQLLALDPVAQLAEHPAAREGPVAFDRRQRFNDPVHVRQAARAFRIVRRQDGQAAQVVDQVDPAVGAHFPDAAVAAQRRAVLDGGAACLSPCFFVASADLSRAWSAVPTYSDTESPDSRAGRP